MRNFISLFIELQKLLHILCYNRRFLSLACISEFLSYQNSCSKYARKDPKETALVFVGFWLTYPEIKEVAETLGSVWSRESKSTGWDQIKSHLEFGASCCFHNHMLQSKRKTKSSLGESKALWEAASRKCSPSMRKRSPSFLPLIQLPLPSLPAHTIHLPPL